MKKLRHNVGAGGFFIAPGRLHIRQGLAHHQMVGRLRDLDAVMSVKADRRRVRNPVHHADLVHVDDDLVAAIRVASLN